MYWYGIDYYYMILILPAIIISFIAQAKVSTTFSKYSKLANSRGMTGSEVARKILDKNGLKNIKIEEVSGNLTDHYDPKSKKIRLSSDIYNGDTIAAASVAAHECGHAIQHKENYTFLKIRASLVPVVNFSTKFGYIAVMIGLLFSSYKIAVIGLLLLLAMLLFQVITLPVEFNASNRAKKQLINLNIIDKKEINIVNFKPLKSNIYLSSSITVRLKLLFILFMSYNV